MHLVVFQIAEGGGVAVLSGEEVFVDSQNLRALRTEALSGQQSQIPAEPALDSSAGEPLAFSQQDFWKTLPKAAAAGPAEPFPSLQFEHAPPHSPAFMPRVPYPPVF